MRALQTCVAGFVSLFAMGEPCRAIFGGAGLCGCGLFPLTGEAVRVLGPMICPRSREGLRLPQIAFGSLDAIFDMSCGDAG